MNQQARTMEFLDWGLPDDVFEFVKELPVATLLMPADERSRTRVYAGASLNTLVTFKSYDRPVLQRMTSSEIIKDKTKFKEAIGFDMKYIRLVRLKDVTDSEWLHHIQPHVETPEQFAGMIKATDDPDLPVHPGMPVWVYCMTPIRLDLGELKDQYGRD